MEKSSCSTSVNKVQAKSTLYGADSAEVGRKDVLRFEFAAKKDGKQLTRDLKKRPCCPTRSKIHASQIESGENHAIL